MALEPRVYKGIRYEVADQVVGWAAQNGINVYQEIEKGLEYAIQNMNDQAEAE